VAIVHHLCVALTCEGKGGRVDGEVLVHCLRAAIGAHTQAMLLKLNVRSRERWSQGEECIAIVRPMRPPKQLCKGHKTFGPKLANKVFRLRSVNGTH
jgi:hypothetical protein